MSILFSIVAAPIYIPTNSVEGFLFLHALSSTCYLQTFVVVVVEANFIYLFIYLFTSLLEYNCFMMVCQFLLYNKVNQLYLYIYPHIPSLLCLPPTLPIPPLQVVTKHRADLPVLCSCFPLCILHLVVYICPCHSLTLSQLTLPPPRFLKSILHVCIFIPVLPVDSS